MVAKNFSELAKLIQKKIDSALRNEVTEKVKDVMQDKVQSEVYDVYTSNSDHPDAYIRREEDSGLKDRDNMIGIVKDGVLSVENVTRMQDTGYYEAGLIEYGNNAGYGNYDYSPAKNSVGDFRQSRPFIEETRRELDRTDVHVEAMKKGLKRQGLDIK